MKWFTDADNITDMGLNAYGNPVNDDEVKLCEIWINTYLIKTKHNRALGTSYKLKHYVEKWARCLHDLNIKLHDENMNLIKNTCYVSNGAFIQAMKNLYFEYSLPKGSSINPYFGAKYNGPYIYEQYFKYIPRTSKEWEQVLAPTLSAINVY